MTPMQNMARWFVIVVVCVASMCFSFLATRRSWIGPPPPKVRLTPLLPELKKEDVDPNGAFGLLVQGLDLLRTENETVGHWPKELGNYDIAPLDPEMADALQRYEPALALIRKAAWTKAGRRVPNEMASDYNAFERNLRASDDLMLASAYRLNALGDVDSAIRELLTSVRIAEILNQGAFLYAQYQSDISREPSDLALCELSYTRNLSKSQFVTITQELGQVEVERQSFAETGRYEYTPVAPSSDEDVDLGEVAGSLGVSSNEYEARVMTVWVKLMADKATERRDRERVYACLIKHYETSPSLGILPAGLPVCATNLSAWDLVRYRDPWGLSQAVCVQYWFERTYGGYLAGLFHFRATLTALAIDQYEQIHSEPPAKLDDLVPGFLDHVPEDPFLKGHTLVYRREGNGSDWLLYSVGCDGRDDGGFGSWPNNWVAKQDLVLSTWQLESLTNSVPAVK